MSTTPKAVDYIDNRKYWLEIATLESAICSDIYRILLGLNSVKITMFAEDDTLDIGLMYHEIEYRDSVEKIIIKINISDSHVVTKDGYEYRISELYLQDKLEVLAWLEGGWYGIE